jgi:hypothetical protein
MKKIVFWILFQEQYSLFSSWLTNGLNNLTSVPFNPILNSLMKYSSLLSLFLSYKVQSNGKYQLSLIIIQSLKDFVQWMWVIYNCKNVFRNCKNVFRNCKNVFHNCKNVFHNCKNVFYNCKNDFTIVKMCFTIVKMCFTI